MKTSVKKLLFWIPRILCIFFAAFISIFAMDVFEETSGFWNTVFALFMHLIPTFSLILILIISWRREWVGGILFFALGIVYLVWSWGRFDWSVYLIIAGPLFLLGILFILGWIYRKEIKAKTLAT